jgi:glycosyltransferase involved in cell wall biosynthesis
VKAINTAPAPEGAEVLHYVGYDSDRGGIVSIVRTLAAEGRFRCILGVNPGFRQLREPPLQTLELPALEGERLGLRTFWRARAVARAAADWLHADGRRFFHGHSRAGLAAAMWLASFGERRVLASVHCYGRRRWFYRLAARRLPGRLFWLSPAMKRYYGCGDSSWDGCIPGCVAIAGRAPPKTDEAPPGPVRLGGIGALVPWKRWDLILEAMAAAPKGVRERMHFAHIGAEDGSPESSGCRGALQARTRELHLEDSVAWMGERPSAEGLLGEIDCLVISSEREPFSISMLEALAAGVPVLAADSGGAQDVIKPRVNGWLFRSGDARDLGRALCELAQAGAIRGARPDQREIERFSAPRVAARWAETYTGLSGAQ